MDDVSIRRRSGASFYSQDFRPPQRPGILSDNAANYSDVSLDAATIRNPSIEDLPTAKDIDLEPPRPARSTFRSICIVLVCTSSMIMNVSTVSLLRRTIPSDQVLTFSVARTPTRVLSESSCLPSDRSLVLPNITSSGLSRLSLSVL